MANQNPQENVQTTATTEVESTHDDTQSSPVLEPLKPLSPLDTVQQNHLKVSEKPVTLITLTGIFSGMVALYGIYDKYLLWSGQGDGGMIGFVLMLLPVIWFVLPVLLILNVAGLIKSLKTKLDYWYLLNIIAIVMAYVLIIPTS